MKNTIIFGWDNALQGESYSKAHECYLATFVALGDTSRLETWTEDDTKAMQGVSPAEIWANTDLWGKCGEDAKRIFYAKYDAMPIVPLREGAVALLTVLSLSGYDVYVVSNKSQEILEYEVAELRAAEFVDNIFGSHGTPVSKVQLLLQAIGEARARVEEVTVIANAKYRAAAEELGVEFIEATTENFRRLFNEELHG